MAEPLSLNSPPLVMHPPRDELPQVVAVRSLQRGDGATFVAANLALMLTEPGDPVLALDLNPWRNDLTLGLGVTPDNGLGGLATEFRQKHVLREHSIQSHTQHYQPLSPKYRTLDLIASYPNWAFRPEFQSFDEWNLIVSIFLAAKSLYHWVVVDLGPSRHSPKMLLRDFMPKWGVDLAILAAAAATVDVFADPRQYETWKVEHAPELEDLVLYVINRSPFLTQMQQELKDWLKPEPTVFLPKLAPERFQTTTRPLLDQLSDFKTNPLPPDVQSMLYDFEKLRELICQNV